ncbi:MAG: biopolymer transporter ExbD [Spirochaetales bacterium]|nr:biopolymer transporter ExbD [Spirochaetales bacterium]
MIEFARYKGKRKNSNGIEVTPLIDMVFLLLIFFLLTSYYTKPAIPVNLPESESAAIQEETGITIVVKKDNTLMIGNRSIPDKELPVILQGLLASTHEKKIRIQADEGVRFGVIVQLMDYAYKAGARDILFVTEKKAVPDD